MASASHFLASTLLPPSFHFLCLTFIRIALSCTSVPLLVTLLWVCGDRERVTMSSEFAFRRRCASIGMNLNYHNAK